MKPFIYIRYDRIMQVLVMAALAYAAFLMATMSQSTFDVLVAHIDPAKGQFNFPPRGSFGAGTVTGRLNGISFALTGNNGSCNGDLFTKKNTIVQSSPLGEPCSPESLVKLIQQEIEKARSAGKPYLEGLQKLLEAVKTAYNL